MSLVCSSVRERIADGERTTDVEEHLAGCPECAAIARALGEIDDGLAAMAAIEPPEALVAATIARAERPPGTANAPAPVPAEPMDAPTLLAASLAMIASALGALVAAPVALARWLFGQRSGRWTFALGSGLAACAALLTTVTFRSAAPPMDRGVAAPAVQSPTTETAVLLDGIVDEEENDGEAFEQRVLGGEVDTRLPAGEDLDVSGLDLHGTARDQSLVLDDDRNLEGFLDPIAEGQHALTIDTPVQAPVGAPAAAEPEEVDGRFGWLGRREVTIPPAGVEGRVQLATAPDTTTASTTTGTFEDAQQDTWAHRGPVARGESDHGERTEEEVPALLPGESSGERADLSRGDVGREAALEERRVQRQLEGGDLGGRYRSTVEGETAAARDGSEAAGASWWTQASSTEGLAFRPRDGWWSTTYVPGDPAIRALHARLASARDVRLGDRTALALAETADPLAPAVDAPTDRAIAIGVSADVAAVEGPTRVRLEVDLRGIRQAAGRRAPMRIAVVIDARSPLGESEQARVRALLTSLGRAAGARDRVTVIAAGAHGGTLVPLGALRHGELEVALRRLFAGEGGGSLAPDAALADAARTVASPDDVGLVLLATPDAAHDGAIDRALHSAAIAGVPTSVVAIGDRARAEDLDAIAIVGQGRRRIVRAPSDADAVARAEIEAASQLVARALRIRVRLAPGVQLVDVLGSRPLDVERARRTREAERAIDRDLASRLGIAADRDEDDDGIRIFVPAFYADDAHAVLLDVVVPGPGAIAEVDVRYKDLVRLENGQASGALSVPRGAPSRGPRELRVVGARLAHETARALADAGDRAQAGDRPGAEQRLREARARIDEARRALPGLSRDRSVGALAQLTDRYLAALASPADPAILAASARLASHRLIVRPRP